jgi:UDP-N-acetylmuramate dehydrogenase
MQVKKNQSLKSYNTFGIDVKAKLICDIVSEQDLLEIVSADEYRKESKFVLGGGSNILFTKNPDAMILHNCIKGINVIKEDDDYAYVKAGGGDVWHQLVLFCIEKDFGGTENLSLIPGSAGAAPIQNIGAYGAELKETFHELEAIHLSSGEKKTFTEEDCQFGYRDSIFKRQLKNQFMISSVTLRLNKKPKFNTTYGAIEHELKAMNVSKLNIQAISQAVINIRRSKLPDPAVIGNAGSFFKNPEVSEEKFEELKKNNSTIIGHKTQHYTVKLGAGWLIEQCGWKGLRSGNVGMHNKQSLVLVNYGNAEGRELYEHALKVQQSVKEKFDVLMEIEVNVL